MYIEGCILQLVNSLFERTMWLYNSHPVFLFYSFIIPLLIFLVFPSEVTIRVLLFLFRAIVSVFIVLMLFSILFYACNYFSVPLYDCFSAWIEFFINFFGLPPLPREVPLCPIPEPSLDVSTVQGPEGGDKVRKALCLFSLVWCLLCTVPFDYLF